MAKTFHFLAQCKELVKTTPNAAKVFNFSIAKQSHIHTQGGDPLGAINQGSEKAREVLESVEEVGKENVETAWDATKNTVQLVTETTTAEADMNAVDTAESMDVRRKRWRCLR
ncbi:hypothetical protein MtrunA17_Chr1g0179711 [Medicago truncatula]|uniref:Chilling-induced protein, putative n=1 Tax=Medicago truncatula TaxID=3880 RepID=A0A072VJ92_MEDTR|nr:uncharacterized protein LOC112417073 isoform X2 [Medicago truncatula]KEH42114.1 chilling-induced protein, putative [Medicago truncatula]RHN79659.1 hypothetical protein MtrunA17_Chr1g0179711 [Medicago truncatula]